MASLAAQSNSRVAGTTGVYGMKAFARIGCPGCNGGQPLRSRVAPRWRSLWLVITTFHAVQTLHRNRQGGLCPHLLKQGGTQVDKYMPAA